MKSRSAAADPDLQIREGGGGGEGQPDPEIRGAQSLKKKRRGEVSPGSATGLIL